MIQAVSFPAGDGAAIGGNGNPDRRAWDWIPFPVLRTAGDDTGAIPLSRVGEGQG